MIDHPNEGLCVPDDLPWREVLKVAGAYLGTMHSGPVDWDPVSSRRDLFAHFSDEAGTGRSRPIRGSSPTSSIR